MLFHSCNSRSFFLTIGLHSLYFAYSESRCSNLRRIGMQKLDIDHAGEGTSRLEAVPTIHNFNWGAFFLTWIWAIGNRSFDRITGWLLVLCIVPYIGPLSALALMVYCGKTGNRRSWENKQWESIGHFERVQRRWAIAGVLQFALAILFFCELDSPFRG